MLFYTLLGILMFVAGRKSFLSWLFILEILIISMIFVMSSKEMLFFMVLIFSVVAASVVISSFVFCLKNGSNLNCWSFQ